VFWGLSKGEGGNPKRKKRSANWVPGKDHLHEKEIRDSTHRLLILQGGKRKMVGVLREQKGEAPEKKNGESKRGHA